MNEHDPARDARSAALLLASQLVVLEDRRADVADLLETGGPHDEDLVDPIANDLAGVRLVIRAVLAAASRPAGATGEERRELERREEEARDLLRVVLSAPREAGWIRAPGRG